MSGERCIETNGTRYRDEHIHSVSVETGEVFSAEFTPRKLPTIGTAKKNCDSSTAAQKGLVYEELNGLLGLQRRGFESVAGFLDTSPNKRCELEGNCRAYSNGNEASPGSSPHVLNSPHPCYHGLDVQCKPLSRKMKFLCSFGGRIVPRTNDGRLRYVGGETRIISIRKNLTYNELVKKTRAICNHPHTIKYLLTGEDLDALISVTSDEDLHNMIEEFHNPGKFSQWLRLFLVHSSDAETLCSYESMAAQPSQFGSTLDHSPRCQRDSPASFHPLLNILAPPNPTAHWFNSYQTTSKSYVQSPPLSPLKGHLRDLKLCPDSGYTNVHCGDGNELCSPYGKSYNIGTPCCCYSGPSEFFPQNWVLQQCLSSQSSFQDCQAKSSLGMYHAISDPQLQCGERYKVTREGTNTVRSNFNVHKSPSLELFSSSKEFSMQGVRDHKQLKWKNEHQKNIKEPDFDKEFSESSKNCINQKNLYPAQEEHCHGIEGICTAKGFGGRNSCISLVSPSNNNSTTICKEHLTDSNACWEDATSKRRVSKNTNFATQSIMLEQSHALNSNARFFSVGPMKENHVVSGTTTGEDGFCLSHELQPSTSHGRGSIGNIATSVSRDRASLNLLDPRASDISLHNSASGAPFRQDIAVCLDMSNGKQKEQSSDGISNPKHVSGKDTFFEFQLSDNTNCSGVPKMSIIVQDATDNLSPDGHPSSHVAPHEQYEPNKKLQPIGKIREADSVCQEPDYKDDKVVGDHEGYSISDATGVETEAGLYGFQIIRNSDLEELRELGSGTFGTVHHGKWRGTDVAIKMIKKSCFTGRLSEQEQLTKDFWREAQILSQLHHPNVVAFYGVVPDGPGGTMATVTEYMANGSLRHVLLRKDRTLDRRKKLMIALDAAFGMEYLHMKNIVHFDLKCENLLVNLGDPQRPVCKVGDFGLSRIKRKTLVSGGVRGTLPWMAPELLNGSNSRVSEKVDVFSFGITMWEILTGEEPFASMHCGEIIGGIVNNNLRPPIPQRCDSEWRKLMEDCWASDPGARPSFTEIKNRLRAMSSAFQPKTRVRR
ncbi:hypothetical protein DM860_001609 [Cuscuta australis]|uniref:Protein kinase domain-containing protein n=1 Tax=Cuscuta australis TaxID=267555 RepID=A0A328EDE6_9ASTE|nr:hypothetical protein DM860_001609 [Cuscuta australis]